MKNQNNYCGGSGLVSSSMAQTPSHFFKVIHASAIEDKKLRIPTEFVRKFGDALSSVTRLTVPDGHTWLVGLTQVEGNIWFDCSWDNFVSYYSICAGEFVVFKYGSDSNFEVLIFDKNGCEINYERHLAGNAWISCPDNRFKKTTHFFSLIFASTIEEKKLMIPKEFERKLGDEVPSVATLQVPDGNVWRIGVTKERGNIWFNYGWDNFMAYYSIGARELVVLQYEFNSNFHVLIFDVAACEINYQRGHTENAKSLCASSSTKYKKTKHNVENEHQREVLNGGGMEFVILLEDMGISVPRTYKSLPVEDRRRAINFVRCLKPNNPSFIVVMQDMKKRYMYVPKRFGLKHLSEDEHVIIQNSNGKKLAMKRKWTRGKCFLTGYAKMIRDKSLMEGDILLFEKIKKMNSIFLKLSILPASQSRVNLM